ncbi:MAG: ABC transporter permease [Dialister invisus]
MHGVSPVDYLVLPRLLSCMAMLPILTVFGVFYWCFWRYDCSIVDSWSFFYVLSIPLKSFVYLPIFISA